jgi:hypothetical protein
VSEMACRRCFANQKLGLTYRKVLMISVSLQFFLLENQNFFFLGRVLREVAFKNAPRLSSTDVRILSDLVCRTSLSVSFIRCIQRQPHELFSRHIGKHFTLQFTSCLLAWLIYCRPKDSAESTSRTCGSLSAAGLVGRASFGVTGSIRVLHVSDCNALISVSTMGIST